MILEPKICPPESWPFPLTASSNKPVKKVLPCLPWRRWCLHYIEFYLFYFISCKVLTQKNVYVSDLPLGNNRCELKKAS